LLPGFFSVVVAAILNGRAWISLRKLHGRFAITSFGRTRKRQGSTAGSTAFVKKDFLAPGFDFISLSSLSTGLRELCRIAGSMASSPEPDCHDFESLARQ
jgi:hypothetical protein